MKVLLVTTIPSPYRIPLFNELAARLTQNSIDFKVIFLSPGYSRRLWKVDPEQMEFDYVQLSDPQITGGERFISFPLSLPRIFFREKPDIIICSGLSLPSLVGLLYAKLTRSHFLIWSGETQREADRRSWKLLRTWICRLLVQSAKSIVVYGMAARQYVRRLGVKEERIFTAINTVNTRFMSETTDFYRKQPTPFGENMPFPPVNGLFVGYMENRKGGQELLRALALIHRNDFGFHFVGSGSQEAAWKLLAQQLGLHHVYFWGYRQTEELPAFFAMADFLVFPSLEELYGLVPIEAMAARLPVIGSVYAGCTEDLFVPGENGMVVDPRNLEDLSRSVEKLICDSEMRRRLALAAEATIREKFSIEHSVDGFIQAINFDLEENFPSSPIRGR